jgi:hypothetical protein
MEKRVQQFINSTTKAALGMITLRPITRALFSFKGALSVVIAISIFRLIDILLTAIGSNWISALFEIDRDSVRWIYIFIDIVYFCAFIASFVLLRRLLTAHRDDEVDRALTLALKQGLLTEHEFEAKRLSTQKAKLEGVFSNLEKVGALTPTAREQMTRIVDDSHRRWILKEALLQARSSGAIDDAIYNKRVLELGLN